MRVQRIGIGDAGDEIVGVIAEIERAVTRE